MLEDLDYIPTPWGNAAKHEGSGGGNTPLDSPNFTGIPTAPTAAPGTNTIQIATTEFVTYAITLTGASLNDHINSTTAHGATSSNTASRIVLRDSSGNFSAGTITANLTGVASEAIKLQTARTINGIPFDGTADITIAIPSPLLLGETETTAYRGDRGKAAYDHINLTSVHGATSSNTASRIVLRDGSGNFSAGTITANLNGVASKADTVAWSGVSSKPNLWSGVSTNGYWGLVAPDGSSSAYIRTSVNGILPYASGGSGTLGTANWPFNSIYGTNIYGNLTGVASEATKLQTARTINGVPFDGTTNITIAVGSSLSLGETETTAYRGDRGKAAYNHISLTTAHGATSSNTASRIVLRDGNGDFSAGTISANLFIGQLGNRATWNSTTATVNSVIGQLSWRHYGNNHTIVDVSNGITPDGTSHNNTNAEIGWVATYPTLVGWNGTNTYGVRVDSARVADYAITISGASYIQSTGLATSWGTTNGTNTGGFNTTMGTSNSATWLLSGTSGGVFRCGIQALDSNGTLRFYQGSNYFQFTGGVLTATTFSGSLSGNVSGGVCAPSYLTIPTTASTTNGRMWIA